MSHRWKLGQVVKIGFGSVLSIMVGIGVVSKVTTNQLTESNRWVAHTLQVETQLKDLQGILVDAETGQRGFLLTQRSDFLEPYQAGLQKFDQTLNALNKLIQDNPEQLQRFQKMQQLSEAKMAEMAETIALMKQGKKQETLRLVLSGKGKQYMDELRDKVAEMQQVEQQLLVERQQKADQMANLANWVSGGGTGLAILFGSSVLWFISRQVVHPLNQVANTIAASSNEIAATVEQQERTSVQQAAAVNETTTTMDQLSASAQQSAHQAETASQRARQVLELAEQGNQAVDRTIVSMRSLASKVSAVAEEIVQLSEQTNQIGNISELVSDLANQTNMLALNAAVEAVRAGEHGKGFAVVASEIRKLADQSKQSAERINALVSDIQSAINSTVMVTDESTKTAEQGAQITQQTAAAFNQVAEAIHTVVLNIQQISLNTQQQATAVQQVVQSMNSLNVAAQETANGISQTRLGTHQLNEAAHKLQSVV